MNLDDPFADDLKNFDSIVNALRSPPPPAPLSRAHRAGSSVVDDPTAVTMPAGHGRSSAAASPSLHPSLEAAASLQTSAPATHSRNSNPFWMTETPPVAGRRATTAVPTSPQAQHTPAFLPNSIPPAAKASGSPSVLASWLDDDSGPPPVESASIVNRAERLARGGPLLPGAAAGGGTQVQVEEDPFAFLEAAARASGAGNAASASLPQIAAANIDAASLQYNAQLEKQRAERRTLCASLDALDAELHALNDKLDTRQAKVEAELAGLCTAHIMKTMEAEEKERQLDVTRGEVRQATAQRLETMRARYADEMASLAQEVREVASGRYMGQLQQLQASIKVLQETISGLHQQRELFLRAEPYTPKGVLLALSDVAEWREPGGSELPPPPLSAASSHEGNFSGGAGSDSALFVEQLLSAGISFFERYCHARLDAMRSHVVDFIHKETLEAAFEARARRRQAWIEDIGKFKTEYGDYAKNMMDRFFEWCRQRAVLKQQNVEILQEEIRSASVQLKQEAAERLSRLTAEVSTKTKRALDRFEQNASEGLQALERQAMLTHETDAAVSQTQQMEVESRCHTEACVRRKLWVSERSSLQDNLQALHARADRLTRERFEQLWSEATSISSRSGLVSLQESLSGLRHEVQDRTAEERARRSACDPSSLTHPCATTEMEQTVRALVQGTRQRYEQMLPRCMRCQEVRRRVEELLAEVVEQRREARQTQNSRLSQIDFIRSAWERDHRQNLCASIHLELPVTVCLTAAGRVERLEGVVESVDTLAPPGDATLAHLLETVYNCVRDRDRGHKELRAARRSGLDAWDRELSLLREKHGALQHLWHTLMERLVEQQHAERVIATQELTLHTETARAEVEGQCLRREKQALHLRHCAAMEEEAAAKRALDDAIALLEQQKTTLQHLSDEQLRLAQEQHRLALEQQRHHAVALLVKSPASPVPTKLRLKKPQRVGLSEHADVVLDADGTPPQQRTFASCTRKSTGLQHSSNPQSSSPLSRRVRSSLSPQTTTTTVPNSSLSHTSPLLPPLSPEQGTRARFTASGETKLCKHDPAVGATPTQQNTPAHSRRGTGRTRTTKGSERVTQADASFHLSATLPGGDDGGCYSRSEPLRAALDEASDRLHDYSHLRRSPSAVTSFLGSTSLVELMTIPDSSTLSHETYC